MDITSLQNPRIKLLVKLRDRRVREREGLMLVEGAYEVEVALKSGLTPESIYLSPELAGENVSISTASEILTVSMPVFEKISYRDNPDGWLAVFPIPQRDLGELKVGRNPFVLVVEAVEKPGNLGAILRTADSAGVDAILVCDPKADLYNHNVVRASRGTLFTVPAVQTTNADALSWLRAHGLHIIAATPSTRKSYFEIDLRKPTAIVVGTENEGLSVFWLDNADEKVHIPMSGTVNSLNVSISTAIIAYELVRQRNK